MPHPARTETFSHARTSDPVQITGFVTEDQMLANRLSGEACNHVWIRLDYDDTDDLVAIVPLSEIRSSGGDRAISRVLDALPEVA